MAIDIVIPTPSKGPRSKLFTEQLDAFCIGLRQLDATLQDKTGVRGWCYMLEAYGLSKTRFDWMEKLINDCRKDGRLPYDFTAFDANRKTEGAEGYIDIDTPKEQAEWAIDQIRENAMSYRPESQWQSQEYYVEMMVEKKDLMPMAMRVCKDYRVGVANGKGQSDINQRGDMAKRFTEHENEGRQCVLLYLGDHDPAGLAIAERLKGNFHQLELATGYDPSGLTVDIFGLTYDFIEKHNLTWIEGLDTGGPTSKPLEDPKHGDHHKPYVQNYLKQFGARKVESNAMITVRDATEQLMRASIERYVDMGAMDLYHDRMAVEREEVASYLPEMMQDWLDTI